MIPIEEWTDIVQTTIEEMIGRDHRVLKGWHPTDYWCLEYNMTTREMKQTQVISCPNCYNMNPFNESMMQLRRWCYFSGVSLLGGDLQTGVGRFIRWIEEPYGFLFGKCPRCDTVPFIFFPSEQATFFYMTQIGRESCIEL